MNLNHLAKLLKVVTCLASLLALIALTNGCCTNECLSDAEQITIGKFNPTALYQSKNATRFAVQGTYCDQPKYGGGITPANFFQEPRTNAFLLISQRKLAARHMDTNSLFTVAEIKTLPPDLFLSLKPEYKLPASYTKIAEFPTNNVVLDVNQQHPHAGMVVVLPFASTVCRFVILSPFQRRL